MKKTLRQWMLEQDASAGARLDTLRVQTIAPKPSVPELLLALFSPIGAWAALLIIWFALAVTNHRVNRALPDPRVFGLNAASAPVALALPNEAPAPLDHHS